MMGIYSKATDLIETLEVALKRGEPMMDLGPHLMETGLALMRQGSLLVDRATSTLERCDHALSSLDRLVGSGESYLTVAHQNAILMQRKLELEVQQLERLLAGK